MKYSKTVYEILYGAYTVHKTHEYNTNIRKSAIVFWWCGLITGYPLKHVSVNYAAIFREV